MKRQLLIQQLRNAYALAESPREKCIEFDILETTFEIEFDDEERDDVRNKIRTKKQRNI